MTLNSIAMQKLPNLYLQLKLYFLLQCVYLLQTKLCPIPKIHMLKTLSLVS